MLKCSLYTCYTGNEVIQIIFLKKKTYFFKECITATCVLQNTQTSYTNMFLLTPLIHIYIILFIMNICTFFLATLDPVFDLLSLYKKDPCHGFKASIIKRNKQTLNNINLLSSFPWQWHHIRYIVLRNFPGQKKNYYRAWEII